MIRFVNKVRYFKIGNDAPKNSCFKGVVTPESIFGGGGSYFNYTERYVGKECDSLMNYTGRYGATISSMGDLDSKEKVDKFKEEGIRSLNKEGAICYEFILSLKDYETATSFSLLNQEQFSSVIKKIMPVYFKSIGLDSNNVSWWEDFHPENRTSPIPHPHIHLLFFEKEPSGTFDRSYGKLPKKALDNFKRMFGNELLKRDPSNIYNQLFDDINISKRNILNTFQNIDLTKVKSLRELYAVLPKTGRLSINSENMKPYKDAVYKIVDNLLNSKECSKEWEMFLTALDKYEYTLERNIGEKVSTRKEVETTKIKEQIANAILSGKKDFEEDNKYENIVKNANHKSSDGTKGQIYKDKDIIRKRLNHRNSGLATKRLINGLLAKRQNEIEMEIEQYLNNQNYDYEL